MACYCLSGCLVNRRLHDHPPKGSANLKLLKDHVTLISQGNWITENFKSEFLQNRLEIPPELFAAGVISVP